MRVLASGFAIASVLLSAPPPAHAAERWAWPVRGEILTHYLNGDDPYAAGQHRGIDIGAADGAAVNAATAGSVTFAGSAGSAGLTVSVRTADGRFDLSHLHLSALSVKKGDRVAAGDRIGSVGTSGRRSHPRPHVHFGVRDAASEHAYLDPLGFLPPLGAPPRPEGPRGTPLPVPAPVRPVRAPAPVTAPRPSGVPARRPMPRSAPRPLPARRTSPVRRPLPVRRPAPVPVPSAPPRAVPRPLGRPARPGPASSSRERFGQGTGSGARTPAAAGPSVSLGPDSALPPSPAPAAPPAPARDAAARGADVGWLLACVGVGLAALLLAWPPASRSARTLVRTAAGALGRPLTGPR